MRKKLIVAILCFAVLIFLGFTPTAYTQYKVFRFTQLGNASLEKGDWTFASLWYRSVLDKDPDNLEILNKLCDNAEYYDDSNAPLYWQQRLEIEPNNATALNGLLRSLLRYQRVDEASELIAQQFQNKDPNFQETLSGYYLSKGDYKAAITAIRESIRISNNEEKYNFQLLNILIRQGSPTDQNEIENLVRSLSENQSNLPDIWRVFIDYSLNKGQQEATFHFLQKLAKHETSTWREKIEYLSRLIKIQRDEVMPFLYTQKNVKPILLEKVSGTLLANDEPRFSQLWLKAHNTTQNNSNLYYQIPYADTLSKLGEWGDLVIYLNTIDWKHLDYYRHALLSLAHKNLGQQVESRKEWNIAMDKSFNAVVEQLRLVQIVEKWDGFENEWITLLEEMLVSSAHTKFAYRKLHQYYDKKDDLWSLFKISAKAIKGGLKTPSIKNNKVFYSLLLNRDIDQNYLEAKVLYNSGNDDNEANTLTYALACYKKGLYLDSITAILTNKDTSQLSPELAHYAMISYLALNDVVNANVYKSLSIDAVLLSAEKKL